MAALSGVKFGINSNMLKWIAIVCMTLDHVAWAFVPTQTPLGIIMHVFGRLTAPIMCFFIAEGFFHTRDRKKYAIRMLVFAFVSWVPFSLFETGRPFFPMLGVIWTLFLGLLALWLCCTDSIPIVIRVIGVIGLCALSIVGDWPIFGVLFVLAFGLNHPSRGGSFTKQAIWFSIPAILCYLFLAFVMSGELSFKILFDNLYQLSTLLAIPILAFYNGSRGGAKWMKWFFYIYYPLHLIILYILRLLLN